MILLGVVSKMAFGRLSDICMMLQHRMLPLPQLRSSCYTCSPIEAVDALAASHVDAGEC